MKSTSETSTSAAVPTGTPSPERKTTWMSSDWVVLSPVVGIAAAEVFLLVHLLVG